MLVVRQIFEEARTEREGDVVGYVAFHCVLPIVWVACVCNLLGGSIFSLCDVCRFIRFHGVVDLERWFLLNYSTELMASFYTPVDLAMIYYSHTASYLYVDYQSLRRSRFDQILAEIYV